MSNVSDIEGLIEEGLARYGHGDLDGALAAWERALELEPENAQAISYVEYVRQNYDLLGSEMAMADESSGPFGIDDEPYQIEILPGELPDGPAAVVGPATEAADGGWFLGDDVEPRRPDSASEEPALELELELDEPAFAEPAIAEPAIAEPASTRLELDEPPESTTATISESGAISFDDETREYDKGKSPAAPREAEFQREITPGLDFGTDTPPGGFTQVTPSFDQSTEVRKRDTGFVRPARPSEPAPELKVTVRTPGKPTTPEPPGGPPGIDIALSLVPGPGGWEAAPEAPDPAADLVESLPSPTPRGPALSTQPTREMPLETRAPATRDFANDKTARRPGAVIQAGALDDAATRPPLGPSTRALVSAPTRDLGLRPIESSMPAAPGEDEPTSLRRPRADEGTRSEVILAFDPIDARSTEILDDVDAGAPARESPEDRTRRRITRLFERAGELARDGELDRAVAAIDLALSEDPTSALAQKLIHRNRDTMLQVFQAFLGDLNRTPQLARPLHDLADAPISPRAAFLLSRIDGTLSLDEILDVSGMPRIEAFRYLSQLYLRGILR
jgi:hypothetical protein